MAYTKITDFAVKDSLLSGNPAKLIRGTEIDAEFTELQTQDAQNVKGPGSATDNAVARYDTTTGKLLQSSTVLISDTGVISGVAAGAVGTPSISPTGDTNTGVFFPAADTVAVATGGTERMRIDSNGYVSLSSVAPKIYQTTAADRLCLTGANDGTVSSGGTIFLRDDTAATNAGGVEIWTGTSATGTERMRIDSAGLVGINKTPDAAGTHATPKLQVGVTSGGAFTVARYSNNASSTGIDFAKSRATTIGGVGVVANSDSLGQVTFSGDDGTGYGRAASIEASVDSATIATGSIPGRLGFFTTAVGGANPTERMRIDSSGNVGVGVTPGAWGASYRAIELNGVSLMGSTATQDFMSLGTNFYFNGTNWIYKSTEYATRYYQVDGAHQWYSAPSGTAGNTITFTQVLAVEKDKSLALQGATSQAGAGISFPATQVASSDANTLDDYEEGTFTPTIVGTSTAGSGTYTTQVGRYTKIGRMVSVVLQVAWTAHTGTGNMRVAGLPFTSVNVTTVEWFGGAEYVNMTMPANTVPCVYVVGNSAQVSLSTIATAAGAVAPLVMDTAATAYVSIQYEAA